MSNIAILLASGSGTRFRSEVPKQFLKLAGKAVLEHTLDVFQRHPRIDQIVLVIGGEHRLLVEQIVNSGGYGKVTRIVEGASTRRGSSAAGIAAIVGDEHKVLVHDAVRPLLDSEIVDRCLDALEEFEAVDTGVPSSDTIVQVSAEGMIERIPNRDTLQLGQTPQGFHARILRTAHAMAAGDPPAVTDDCGLILHFGLGQVKVVAGSVENIKVTYPSDIYLADRLFQLRSRSTSGLQTASDLKGKVLVVFGASRGIGERIHQLAREQGAIVVGASRANGVDVSNPFAVRECLAATASKYGRVDMVANTAGVLRTGLLMGQDYATIDEQLLTNLRGSIIVAREAFDLLKKSGGSIVLFTSSSFTRGRARSSVYSATKAAIVNLTQGLAEEFRPFGVRINAMNPERTATPMRTENFGNESAAELLNANDVAIATLGTLLSDATGEVIDVRRSDA